MYLLSALVIHAYLLAIATASFGPLLNGISGINGINGIKGLGHQVGKHVGSVAAETWKHLDHAGQEASEHVSSAAAEAWWHLHHAGQDVSNQIGSGETTPGVLQQLESIGKDSGKRLGEAAAQTKDWVYENPGGSAALVACVVAGPLSVAAVPALLGAAGFTSGGVAAGSLAAGAHASIGNVAAGSVFATLQSAGAGGAGLAVVNTVVGTTATAGAGVVAVADSLVKTKQKGGKDEDGGKKNSGKGRDSKS